MKIFCHLENDFCVVNYNQIEPTMTFQKVSNPWKGCMRIASALFLFALIFTVPNQQLSAQTLEWSWETGSQFRNMEGVFPGTGLPPFVPGARWGGASWTDGSDYYLFGGYGEDDGNAPPSGLGYLGDLWRYDGTNWFYIRGSNVRNNNGIYGMQGVTAPANQPGARRDAMSWIDASGDLWLFGGDGFPAGNPVGALNDLWRFDGTNWTWEKGDNVRNVDGVYNVQGVPNITNKPGGRESGVTWYDNFGNLWLFGGFGYDVNGNQGYLNDLWRYNPTTNIWTWDGR